MVKTKQTMLAQLIARAVIFGLFLLGLFIIVPALRYLFMLFIIVNVVLGFINGKRNIPINIIFILAVPSLFVPVLEYLTTVILVVLTGVHLLLFYLWWKGGGEEEKEDDKKKKFHISRWLIAGAIIIGVVLLFLILIAFAFTSSFDVSSG
ncbi:MAG: hypothetical protein KKB79_03360 [Nanoarchaeota archaeon]|nr:hypothetical protein [Nanoarchaeota archaeon]